MLFDTAKEKCIIEILNILERRKTSYSNLFRETKVSHITLQNALSELSQDKFITKAEEYGITDKGKKLLRKLEELKEILE